MVDVEGLWDGICPAAAALGILSLSTTFGHNILLLLPTLHHKFSLTLPLPPPHPPFPFPILAIQSATSVGFRIWCFCSREIEWE